MRDLAFNKSRRRGAESGNAAVECALILPILLLFLTFPFFYAKCFWHYTAAQKAAQDSARYLSSIPPQHMRSRVLAEEAARLTAKIANLELAELDPGKYPPTVEVFCGNSSCNGVGTRPLPTTIRVLIKIDMYDTIFGTLDTGRYGVPITADATMSYVGT
jgi:Flp pilus assembly protein TadG